MPRFRLHLAGILLTLLLAGCAGSEAAAPQLQSSPTTSSGTSSPAAQPSPQRVGPPSAAQQLAFTGDLSGTMSRLTAAGQGAASECTQRPRTTGAWASTLYGYLGDRVYGVVVLVKPYNGPATYDGSEAQVQILSQDQQRVWQSTAGDQVSFTVDNGEQTGSMEANLHDLRSNQR